jgi:hypothetical protein
MLGCAHAATPTRFIRSSAWAFASPVNTRGNPVEAAKAIVPLEYLSGEPQDDPRWIGRDSSIKLHMTQARDKLRRLPSIRPDTPPLVVANTLLALSLDLQTGNLPAATQVLASPVFTRPQEPTLQTLSNLPYLRQANLATARVQEESCARGPPPAS